MKNFFLLICCSLLFINVNATVRTATSSGLWNNPAIWGGTVPATNDDVVINAGQTVTINVNPNNIVNVTINGTLQFDATGTGRTWTVTGNFTVNSGGTFNCAAPGSATTHTLNYNGTNLTNNGTFNMVNGTNVCNVIVGGSATQSINGSSSLSFNKFILNNTGGKFVIDYGGGSFTPSETAPTKLNTSISTSDSLVIKQGLLIGCATANATIAHTAANFRMGSGTSKITSSVNIFTSVVTITVNTGMILNDAANSNVTMTVNGSFTSPSMSQANASTAYGVLGPNCAGGAGNATALTINGDWNMTDIFVFVGNTKLFGGTEPNNPTVSCSGNISWASSETHTIDLPFTSDDFFIKTCFFGLFDSFGAFPSMVLNGGTVGSPKTFNVAFDVFDAEVQSSSPAGSLTVAQISESMANWTINGNWKILSGASMAIHSDNTLAINGSLSVQSGGEIAGSETETEDAGYVPTNGPAISMGTSGILHVENAAGLGKGLLTDAGSAVAIKNRTADIDWNLNAISAAGTIDYSGTTQSVTDRTYNNLAFNGSGTKTLLNAITVNGTLAVGTGTTLANAGFNTLALSTVTNNGTHSGTGKIVLGGSSGQVINGSGAEWGNFEINNAAGVSSGGTINTTGNVTLTNGILTTSSVNALAFGPSGGFIGGSASSCVYGPVLKNTISTSEFVFQLGKGGNYRPLSIIPSSTSSTQWSAEYFNGAYLNTTTVQAPITAVNTFSYWICDKISGSANAKVKLQWNTTEALADLNGLTVARWSGSAWTDAGVTDVTGGTASGTITSNTVTAFSPFTLGEANTLATGTITGSPFCPTAVVSVPFTSTGTYNAGNIYTAQLSDKNGSFTAAVNVGTLSSTANSGNISATVPSTSKAGTKYRFRVVSSNPPVTGGNNGVNLSVSSCGAPTGITATGIAQTSATINWNAVTCAVTYTLQYRKQGVTAWTKKKNLTGTSKLITGLLANTVYEYQMQTFCSVDNKSKSALSAIQTFMTTLKLEAPLSLETSSMNLYPNPTTTSTVLFINSKEASSATIFVFNAVGQVMFTLNTELTEGNNQISLNLESLPAGVYLVNLRNGDESTVERLVKE